MVFSLPFPPVVLSLPSLPFPPSVLSLPPFRNEYHFKLSAHFEIHDDIEVLRRMGLNRSTPEEINAMVSPEMRPFLPEHVQLTAGTRPTAVGSTCVRAKPVRDPNERGGCVVAGRADNARTVLAYEPTSLLPSNSSPVTSPLRGQYSSPPASMGGASSPIRSAYSPYPISSSPAPSSPHKAG